MTAGHFRFLCNKQDQTTINNCSFHINAPDLETIEEMRIVPQLLQGDVRIKEHFAFVVGDTVIKKYKSGTTACNGNIKEDMETSGWNAVEMSICPAGGLKEINDAITTKLRQWYLTDANDLWTKINGMNDQEAAAEFKKARKTQNGQGRAKGPSRDS